MSYPAIDDVKEVLEKYHGRIRGVVERAWAEWRAMAAFRAENGFDPFLYSRTVANVVFDAIARYAVAEFASDPSVHVEIEAQTVKLFFKGAVSLASRRAMTTSLAKTFRRKPRWRLSM